MKNKATALLMAFCALLLFSALLITTPVQAEKKLDPVRHYIGGIKLYPEIEYKNLTIIPVKGPELMTSLNPLTLDDAIKRDYLVVKEVSQSGNVNELAVWNNSKRYVFIMAGEILAGSKQDRVLKDDVLLPPDSGKVLVSVYCVEHGRWTYKSDKFYSENKTANLSVRQKAKVAKDQSAVWESVGETNENLSASAPTGSLSKSYEAPVVQEKKETYSHRFLSIPDKYPTVNGVIVMVNNRVMVADLFGDQRVFEKMWPKLLDSYVIEALSRQGREVTSDIKTPEKFLENIKYANISYNEGSGTGKNVEIDSKIVSGSGLVKDSALLHVDAFPKYKVLERPANSRIQRNYRNNNIEQRRNVNDNLDVNQINSAEQNQINQQAKPVNGQQ